MTKNQVRRSDSKLRGLASRVRDERNISKRIELSSLHIGLELSIPQISIEFGVPAAKLDEFFRGQLANLLSEILDSAHHIHQMCVMLSIQPENCR